ncbi:MAG: ribonuclease P protein component [Dehalococcoidia bacterium]
MVRPARLRRGLEFDTAYSQGTVLSGPLFVLRYRPNDCSESRWGFAIGRKLEKHAVARNRLRRKLREAARAIEVPVGFDFILTARRGALSARQLELQRALAARLQEAGLGESGSE